MNKETTTKLNDFFKFVLYVFTILGGSVVLIDYFVTADDTVSIINHILVGVILLVLLLFCGVREWMSSRKQVYANITPNYHYCLHEIRNLYSYLLEKKDKLNELSDDAYIPFDVEDFQKIVHGYLKTTLTYFSNTFYVLTGTKCRACIKAIYEQDGRLYVFTQARDEMSSEVCYETDKYREQHNQDPLDRNTDFYSLYNQFNPSNRCFFSNDLTSTTHYNSTSFEIYGSPGSDHDTFLSKIPFVENSKQSSWPLPYKSAIVWPIQQKNESNLSLQHPVCVGFLAIDSESRNVFNYNWDFELGAGIADNLYHPLVTFSWILQEVKRREEIDGR